MRADADLPHAIENADRRRVLQCRPVLLRHQAHLRAWAGLRAFVDGVVDLTQRYQLGSPLDPETTLGPVVRATSAAAVRGQMPRSGRAARAADRRAAFAGEPGRNALSAPQVLVDVDHTMPMMCEETFGPAVGIVRVGSDEEAVG